VELCRAELGDLGSLERACAGVEVVVHTAAAVGSFGAWEHFHETGVLGTERLLAAAAAKGVQRFVHVSSIAAYGLKDHGGRVDEDAPFDAAPQRWNHYVREKVMSEERVWAAHAAGKIAATVVRPSVVIGARDRNAVPRMADLLRLPIAGLPGRPTHRFPVVTIEDCVDAIVRAAGSEIAVGRAYNVSGARSIALAEIYGLIARHAGLPAPKLYVPTAVALPLTARSRRCGSGSGSRVSRSPRGSPSWCRATTTRSTAAGRRASSAGTRTGATRRRSWRRWRCRARRRAAPRRPEQVCTFF
jgi:nucleoside-diphosphate-sugar epimerase